MTTPAITLIPTSFLREHPGNPRKHYDQAGLDELAASIASQGLLQPIAVRNTGHDYQVVFGHRRLRAAKLAGLEQLPCILMDLTDLQVAEAQIHENLERQDVTAWEEGESYRLLIADHGSSVEAIMAQTGKSRTYIYNRIKLCALTPELRSHVTTGVLPAEVATLIARMPGPLQGKAFKAVCIDRFPAPTDEPPTVMSFRAARDQLRRLTIPIAQAAFDTTDAGLVMGVGACTTCPNFSDSDPTLLDALGAGVCIDRTCFDVKTERAAANKLDAARAAGRVIEGEAAQAIEGDGPWDDPRDHVAVRRAYIEMPRHHLDVTVADACAELGEPMPQVTTIEHFGKLVDCYAMADMNAIATRLCAARGITPDTGEDREDDGDAPIAGGARQHRPLDGGPAAQWASPAEAAVAHAGTWRTIRLAIMRRVLTTPRSIEDLRLLVDTQLELGGMPSDTVLAAMGWPTEDDDAETGDDPTPIATRLDACTADQLAALLLMLAIDEDSSALWAHSPDRAQHRIALAQRYGVDVLPPEATAQAEEQPEPDRDPNTADMFESTGA